MLTNVRNLSVATFVATALLAFTAGCAPVANQRPPERASAKSTAFETALRKARTRRADLQSASPPVYSGDGSNEAAQAYMKLLVAWADDILRTRLPSTVDAYAAAARVAPSSDAEMATITEALDVAEQTRRRFVDAAESAEPSSFESVPDAVHIFRLHVEANSAAFTRNTLQHCLERAKALAVETPARCREGIAHIDEVKRQIARFNEQNSDHHTYGPLPEVPWVDTSHPARCAFAGSATPGPGALYARATEGPAIAQLDERSVLRIERLELPVAAGGRYKVTLSYPVRATVWLDAAARPFELPARVDLVPDHVWFEPRAAASGARAGGSRIRLGVSLPRNASGVEQPPARDASPMGNFPNPPDLEATPPGTTVLVDCSQVALVTRKPISSAAPDTTTRNAPWRLLRAGGRVTLFRDADARSELGRVTGHSAVFILGTSGNLTHVSGGGDGYDFDGWVRSEDVTEDASMSIGLIARMRVDDAFRPRGDAVEVRMQPDRAAPVVMTLAPEAVMHETGEEGDFAAVEITGLASNGPRYFVLRTELEPYRRAATN